MFNFFSQSSDFPTMRCNLIPYWWKIGRAINRKGLVSFGWSDPPTTLNWLVRYLPNKCATISQLLASTRGLKIKKNLNCDWNLHWAAGIEMPDQEIWLNPISCYQYPGLNGLKGFICWFICSAHLGSRHGARSNMQSMRCGTWMALPRDMIIPNLLPPVPGIEGVYLWFISSAHLGSRHGSRSNMQSMRCGTWMASPRDMIKIRFMRRGRDYRRLHSWSQARSPPSY